MDRLVYRRLCARCGERKPVKGFKRISAAVWWCPECVAEAAQDKGDKPSPRSSDAQPTP